MYMIKIMINKIKQKSYRKQTIKYSTFFLIKNKFKLKNSNLIIMNIISTVHRIWKLTNYPIQIRLINSKRNHIKTN